MTKLKHVRAGQRDRYLSRQLALRGRGSRLRLLSHRAAMRIGAGGRRTVTENLVSVRKLWL